ncbi:DUF4350 domain-containing protein [Fibrella aquatilis]|uniref:DUF4350 domain-containing protein n=1 Tax=Fibrella aquatilis TaxID=2817059 RepID=A0A939GCJ0_9BACT|nr:DUF4350 domain-containing protein [Fibrella aquatilis]MBO0934082.1 DUF4350 domain-containing protein [Fibrella aquatilis]
MKKPNKYLLILLGMVVVYTLMEYFRPKTINWDATYRNTDTQPLGSKAMFELLPALVKQPAVTNVRKPIYNQLTEETLPANSNYLFVQGDFDIDDLDQTKLLAWVKRGNTAFISAYSFPDTLEKVLHFRAPLSPFSLADSTLRTNFVNPALRTPNGYNVRHDDGRNYLQVTQPNSPIRVLARNARQQAIFLRIPYGKGTFFIHNLPLAFTNYYALDSATTTQATGALSYLPARPTYWDEYQKQGRFSAEEQSLLRYVLKQPALTWGYYILVWSLLLYAIFAGKRTQRIIPVAEPLKNTTLDFVQTVGRVYFQQGNHDNVARKQIRYFLARLRERYALDTSTLDNELTDTLTRKSGVDAQVVAQLVLILNQANRAIGLNEADLITINAAIEKFQAAAGGGATVRRALTTYY